MLFQIHIDERQLQINIPPYVLEDGGEFFDKMDQDMDQGWQMGPSWVEHPNKIERCQVAADKLLAAVEAENETLLMLMAGYILTRNPGVQGVRINTTGELQETEFF